MQSNIRIKQLLLSCLVFLVSNIHAAPNPDSSSPSKEENPVTSSDADSSSEEEITDIRSRVRIMDIIKLVFEEETRSKLQYHNLSFEYSGGASKKKTEKDSSANPTLSTEDTKKEIKIKILKGAFGAIDDIADNPKQTKNQGKRNNDTNIEIDLNELIESCKYKVTSEEKARMVKELEMILEDVFNENMTDRTGSFKKSLKNIDSDKERIERAEQILKVFSCLRPNFYAFIHLIEMLKESITEFNIKVEDAEQAKDIMTRAKKLFVILDKYEKSSFALQHAKDKFSSALSKSFINNLKDTHSSKDKSTLVDDYYVSIFKVLYDLVEKREREIEKNDLENQEETCEVAIEYTSSNAITFVAAEQCTDWQTKVVRQYNNKDLFFLNISPISDTTN